MTEEVTEGAAETQGPEIGIGDLVAVVDIIDTCVQRGAFEGSEIAEIGEIRTKFARFINYHLPDEFQRTDEEIAISEAID
jgi:hypothetical protein